MKQDSSAVGPSTFRFRFFLVILGFFPFALQFFASCSRDGWAPLLLPFTALGLPRPRVPEAPEGSPFVPHFLPF